MNLYGPKHLTDIMIIIPATGNTMAKLAHDIIDTPATMAAKSHIRNDLPLVIAPSTNNGLGANAVNIGSLLNTRWKANSTYFVMNLKKVDYLREQSFLCSYAQKRKMRPFYDLKILIYCFNPF